MEDYAEELRTPPVPLISLVGCPELHHTVSAALHSDQPPINTLALPDFSKISVMARKPRDPKDAADPSGFLKRDWLLKHRTRVPAAVAAMFASDQVSGDPAQWLQVCTDLENLKAVIRGRNTKLIVVLVQSTLMDELNEDRMIALRKRAEIESKYIILFAQNIESEFRQSLNKLSSILAELSTTYYREEGRRIRYRIEKRSFSSVELNIRYCFKVAVYAEFRRDWAEALRFYEDAYHVLREMVGTSTRLPPIQRLVEIKSLAEQLHFKVSTLLLHGGKVGEAVVWFQQHIASYKRLVGAPEVVFLHWEWVSKQFLVFAELLETSSATVPKTAGSGSSDRPLTEWEFQPANYYQLAAHYLREKRYFLDAASSVSETFQHDQIVDAIQSTESVVPSVFVGQFARLLEQAHTFSMQSLTDKEYVRYVLAEGNRFQDAYEIIALLKKSFESYSNLKAQRMASYCGFQMAREYFTAGDLTNARQIFSGIMDLYRQEGWVTLLWGVLGYMRECSRKLGSTKDFIEFSLEMAALPITGMESFDKKGEFGPAGSPSLQRREEMQKKVFGFLRGESEQMSNAASDDLTIAEDKPIHLEIDPVSPLRSVCLASAAFHDQAIRPNSTTLVTVSLLTQLPHPVEVDQIEIKFNQPACNFTIINEQKASMGGSPVKEQSLHVETVPNLTLVTNKWLRLTYEIKSGQSGKLECQSVIVKIGHHFMICCRAESPASIEDLPLWRFEDRVETFPTKDPSLAFTGQKFIQVEEAEAMVDLILSASGPALIGENFVVPLTVVSKGHAVFLGELKTNLVDTKGGGLISPREYQNSSSDSLQVELLGVSGSPDEDECETGDDKIKNVQQSFGLMSIPNLKTGESWSGKLELRWNRAKPVMLFVSLGYSPSNDAATPKLNVHRSMQIEGKTPLVLGHHFMTPFRRDSLLLSRLNPSDSDPPTSLALNEPSILVVNARNCTEVPLRLLSISIEVENTKNGPLCKVLDHGKSSIHLGLLLPGEDFRHVFSVTPLVESPKLCIGTVCLRWRRDFPETQQLQPTTSTSTVVTEHKLSDIKMEKAPLAVVFECPPHAVLGTPFSFFAKIQNQTHLLQEVKYSLADSTGFVSSGPHNDATFILPNAEHTLRYKLVPLFAGHQQLPRVTIISVRYSACLNLSQSASSLFVFPSQPHFSLTKEPEQNLVSTDGQLDKKVQLLC